MANLRDIKRRITSVKSTQKITSAMKMVSAAKLRRATEAIEAARPYAERMREALAEVVSAPLDASHPLFEVRDPASSVEIVVITSDRGLAGAFNNSVIKHADAAIARYEREVERVELSLVGKKAIDYYKRRRPQEIVWSSPVGSSVDYLTAERLARRLGERFEKGETDRVDLVYSEFVSTLTQRPRTVALLPIRASEPKALEPVHGEPEGSDARLPFEIEPDAASLLARLVPKAVEVELFRGLLENQAGEHAARMTAMENATRNTEELIEKLTLEFNRARQAAITRELVEIVTGAQALD